MGCVLIVANEMRLIPKEVNESKIRESLENSPYAFVAWEGQYRGTRTPVKLTCEHHGEWVMYLPDIFKGIRCAACKNVRRKTSQQATLEIESACQNMNLTFVCFPDGYRNIKSVVQIRCSNFHTWKTTFASIVSARSSCPVCCVNGFQPEKPAVLYVLKSSDNSLCKVGITNEYSRRMTELRRATPFDFTTIKIINKQRGEEARNIEKLIHDSFETAGLRGFSGATEWMLWNPEIPLWLEYL